MKKLILIMFMILLVGTVSAFEFDNVKNYDEETKTVDIRNSILGIPFLQLGKVAEIKLNTPQNYLVARGYQKVAEFEVTSYGDYNNAFKELELFDKKKGDKKFVRDYDFKALSYETIIVDDWKTECSKVLNEMNGSYFDVCERVLVGNHEEQQQTWTKLTPANFKKDDVVIVGIFTEVLPGDKVEWIPNFFGVRIDEWAEWTESLNVNLVAYWKFDELSGTLANDSTGSGHTGKIGTGVTVNQDGIINNSFDFETASTSNVSISESAGFRPTDNLTISAWFNASVLDDNRGTIMDKTGDGARAYLVRWRTNSFHCLLNRGGTGSGAVASAAFSSSLTGTWHHVACTYDKATIRLYINGTSVANTSFSDAITYDTRNVSIGSQSLSGLQTWDGLIDEVGFWNRTLAVGEIQDLYNGGTGITFTDVFAPTITLNSPANNSNFSAANITFNATATATGATLTNVSLYIDDILNESNTSGVDGVYLFDKNLSDGTHTWFVEVTDDSAQNVNASRQTFSVDTLFPEVEVTVPSGRQTTIKIGDNQTLTYSINDTTIDTCTLNYNGANSTLNCSATSSSFLYVNGVNNLTVFGNDSFSRENSSFVSWDYNFTENVSDFNATVFTTSGQSFSTNITINSDFTTAPTDLSIIYNGTTTTGGTVTSLGGDDYSFSQTIDIPDITNGTSSWLYTFTLNSTSFNTSTSTQDIIRLNLLNCNTAAFINFTFRNETLAEENITATFDSNWNYFLGSGAVSRTLSFTNATENSFYGFCLNAVNDTLFTQVNVSYSNSISQQRQFRPTLLTLTNATTNQVLYLLPTVDGLFNTFRTEDTLGNTIIGARGTITRTLGSSTITSAVDVTDGSGLVIFFLDPDITYTATFTASGFADNAFTFVPTTDLRTVIMSSVAAAPTGSNISLGMSYIILPTNATLNNGTDITFSFNVSSVETITFMGFTISNDTTTFLSVNQSGNGTVSGTINTGNNNTFTGVFTITTLNETIILTRTWKIEQGFIGDYSIFNQLNLFIDYGFRDFIRLLMVLATLAIVMIFMSREIGIDEEVKMVVAILIVWAFSVVGWLDTGIAMESTSSSINNLSQFSNQYGIAIVSTVAAAYFILRRAFRQI